MNRVWLAAGIATAALGATLVMAQEAPEDLLPPGFDKPAPARTATPRPAPTQSVPRPAASPAQSPSAGSATSAAAPVANAEAPPEEAVDLSKLPTLQQLEAMSTEELDELFGLRPKFDIPPGARRSMERVGVIAPEEGGLPVFSLANQPAGLVRATLAGLKGPVVSRWGHILLRRALASRMDAPSGMNPAEFAALRAQALNAMGEFGVARALVQDVDTGNYSPALTNAAIASYIGTGDVVGACPAVLLGTTSREDPDWKMLSGICHAYDGEETRAQNDLRKLQVRGEGERIDVLLSQRLAGAAGTGRKSVTIEWNNIDTMTPLRFALVNAVGETIPDGIAKNLAPAYLRQWATAPMATLPQRMRGALGAGQAGILSSAALVDLYSQVYADQGGPEDDNAAAARLREAYVSEDPSSRLSAIKALWDGSPEGRYGRLVLTSYAAARMTPSDDFADDAGPLIASMLAAGLDRDAWRWASVVEGGSLGWGLLVLARQSGEDRISGGEFEDFMGADDSANRRKSRMLLAGLAGLGRVSDGTRTSYASELGVPLDTPTRWTRAIDRAAAANNRELVALLAGLGMQGETFDRMTARHLYHIVSALNRVGLEAEARMIAAEAVARA